MQTVAILAQGARSFPRGAPLRGRGSPCGPLPYCLKVHGGPPCGAPTGAGVSCPVGDARNCLKGGAKYDGALWGGGAVVCACCVGPTCRPRTHGWGPHDGATRRHCGFQFFVVGLPPRAMSINSALFAPSLVRFGPCAQLLQWTDLPWAYQPV